MTGAEGQYGIIPAMPGLAPDGKQLPAGFAYLIRSSVRMTELYPMLGELLFCARASRNDAPLSGTEGWETRTNVIGLFVDDDPGNLFSALGSDGDSTEEMAQNFVKGHSHKKAGYCLPELAAWMDTYGTFARGTAGLKELLAGNDALDGLCWLSQSIVGAGNPMSIYRFFRTVGDQEARGPVNIFLLNSLSNLYRNLGLAETAALLKRMLEDIWLRGRDDVGEKVGDGSRVRGQDGLFFAVLQEGVMEPAEASYLESFFDGVYQVEPYRSMDARIPRLRVDSLPLQVQLPKDVLFAPKWQDKSLVDNEGKPLWAKMRCPGCFVTTFPAPPSPGI